MTTRKPTVVAAALVVSFGLIVLYAGWGARWRTASGDVQTADSNVVAVLPFHIGGEHPALPDLRDWIQDLLVARLTGEGSPRALNPRDVADALGSAGAAGQRGPSPETSRRLHDRLGTPLMLYGGVTGTPLRLSLGATLADVPSGATLAEAQVEGSADSLPYLADRVTTRLLAVRAASREAEDPTVLANTSLAALRAYLAGREAYRRGLAHQAEEYFDRALLLDTTFTAAGLGVVALQGNYWFWRSGDERWQADAVWSQRHRMSWADRALLEAYLGPRYPRPSTAAELIAAGEEAARLGPQRVEAWYVAGKHLYNLGRSVGAPDWEARSLAALRRALVLDSTHAQVLDFLVRLTADAGDSVALRRYVSLFVAHNAQALAAGSVRWRAAVALGDSATLAELRLQFGQIGIGEVNLWRIINWGQWLGGVGLDDAERAVQELMEHARTPTGRGIASGHKIRLLLNRGRPAEARRLLAEFKTGSFAWFQSEEPPEFRVYAALFGDGDPSDGAAAAQLLEAHAESSPHGPGGPEQRQAATCALAHWRAARGDLDGARALLARIGPLPTPTDYFEVPGTDVCVAAVEAVVAVGGRGSGAPAAIERLDSLLRVPWSNGNEVVFTIGNLIAARLYEARGDLRRALHAVRRAQSVLFLSTRLREEGRLAALHRDRAGAIRAYRHYLALRSAPEPHLRPEAERVRAELERLEQGLK